MSLTKSTTRRVALFTSSSLVAAGLTAALSIGAAALPTAAVAQAVCIPAPSTGAGTNNVTYNATTYPTGITCAAGPAAMTVTTVGTGTLTVTANGVNLSGGAQDVTWNSTAGTVSGGTGTAGPVIDAITTAGDITVRTAGVTGTANTVEYGIRARSDSGDITISNTANVTATNTTTGIAGIYATTGGEGAITITAGIEAGTSSPGQVNGRLYGIYTQTANGDLTLNVHKQVASTTTAPGGAAIFAKTGAGSQLTILLQGNVTLSGNVGAANGRATSAGGAGIVTEAGGDADITIGHWGRVQAATYGLDLGVLTGTTTTLAILNNPIDAVASSDGRVEGGIRAQGGGAFDAQIDGVLSGGAELSGIDQGATIALGSQGLWAAHGAVIAFGDGDDSITIAAGGEQLPYNEVGPEGDFVDTPMFAAGGVVSLGGPSPSEGFHIEADGVEAVQTIDFGDGADAFDNSGYLFIGAPVNSLFEGGTVAVEQSYEAEVRLEALETFVNRGVILLGGIQGRPDEIQGGHMRSLQVRLLTLTDQWHDDILAMPGTVFKGSRVVDGDGATALRWNGDLAVGEVWFDVDIAKTQSNCDRDPVTGDLAAADCLILDGGSTDISKGQIYVRVVEGVPGDRGSINTDGIVLVDMGETGTSAHGHVAISPNQEGYNPDFGGYMDKGAFAYIIAFDEETNQHKLFSTPSGNAFQFPLLAQAAQGMWRLSMGSWLDRQADLRGQQAESIGGGLWGRVNVERSTRDVGHTVTLAGQDFTFDNSFEQNAYALTAGADLLFGAEGDTAYVAGLMLGYAHTELEYEDSLNTPRLEAWSGGGYASFISGGLFVDAAVNAHNTILRNPSPAMQLFPSDAILSTRAITVGGQIEAGYRLPVFGGGAFIEPLAGLSYVRSDIRDIDIAPDDPARQGVVVEFDDPTSLRASVGARAGVDQDFGVLRAQFSGLLRLWNEFEDETRVELINPGSTGVASDSFGGQFTEVGLGTSVFSPGGGVTGFINVGGRFGDAYQATTAAAGVRVNW